MTEKRHESAQFSPFNFRYLCKTLRFSCLPSIESDRKDGTRKQSQKISGDGKPNSYSCPLLWSNRPQSPKDLFQTPGGKSLHQLTNIGVHVRVVFQKGWFWRMFARNENRNEGTFGCSPGTKTGTRVHSHVTPERKLERGHIRQNHSPSLAAQSAPCREAKAPPSPEPAPPKKKRTAKAELPEMGLPCCLHVSDCGGSACTAHI